MGCASQISAFDGATMAPQQAQSTTVKSLTPAPTYALATLGH